MALWHIAGGVALMLFGIRFLRKGLERVFGHALHAWIERMGTNRGRASLAGLAFGTVAPSSTAQTLLVMQLLNAGKLSPERMLGFLLGANVGITVTVQLIAFRFFDYNWLFLIAGVATYLWARSETGRGVGQAVLSLGLVFLAMQLIGDAARGLTASEDFNVVLGVLTERPLALVAFAAGLTFLTQSSTAVIGIAIAVAEAGAGGHAAVLPVVLGANVGLGLTSLVAGWETLAGKRLAIANLVLKCAVVGAALAALPVLAGWIAGMPGGVARHAANFHTTFNVVVAVLGAVCAGLVGRVIARAVRPPPAADPLGATATHLEPSALANPIFALANAARETLRLTEEVKAMLEGAGRGLRERDAELVRRVQEREGRVDELHAAIKHYLSQIPEEAMTPRDSQLQFGLLHFVGQLETVGDVIDKTYCHQILKQVLDPRPCHPQDEADLAEMHRRTVQRLEMAILVLTTRDARTAQRFLQEGERLKAWCLDVQRAHYQRIGGGDERALEASTRFLEMLNALSRIGGQVNTIGHTFARGRPGRTAQAGGG